jgi:hypothetical protein
MSVEIVEAPDDVYERLWWQLGTAAYQRLGRDGTRMQRIALGYTLWDLMLQG